jgi:hypothetical protein
MAGKKLRIFEAGGRVRGFLDAHKDAIQVPTEMRDIFDKALADLGMYLGVQGSSEAMAIGETAAQKKLRDDIYHDFIGPIGAVADYLELDDPRLTMYARIERHGEFDIEIESLMTAAAEHEAALAARLMRPDFLAQLRSAVDQLRTSTARRARLRSEGPSATAGGDAAAKQLMNRIAVFKAVIPPLLIGNPALLADWKASSRVHKTRVEPRPGGSVQLPPDDTKGPQT